MKKGLLTFIAALVFCLGANAQYVMKVTKTNGEVTEFSADEVQNVSFDQGELSVRNQLVSGVRSILQEYASKRLNFSSLTMSSQVVSQFVSLLTPQTIAKMAEDATTEVQKRLKPVEEGSELAQLGYKEYLEIYPQYFDGIYTFKEDGTFEKAEADHLEFRFTFKSNGQEVPMTTIIKGNGNMVKMALPDLSTLKGNKRAVVINVPESFDCTISTPVMTVFDIVTKVNFEKKSQSQYVSLFSDKWVISNTAKSHVQGYSEAGLPDDDTMLNISNSFDPETGEIASTVSFTQNGLNLYERSGKAKFPGLIPTVQQLTQMMTIITTMFADYSILDIAKELVESGQAKTMVDGLMVGILQGSAIEEVSVKLFDFLIFKASVSDVPAVLELQKRMTEARRSGASEAEIQEYVDNLNKYVNLRGEVQGVDMVLPMTLVTFPIGVDYWAMPAVKFPDENHYTPFAALLDIKSINYLINIADHCVQPLMGTAASVGSLAYSLASLYFGVLQAKKDAASQQATILK